MHKITYDQDSNIIRDARGFGIDANVALVIAVMNLTEAVQEVKPLVKILNSSLYGRFREEPTLNAAEPEERGNRARRTDDGTYPNVEERRTPDNQIPREIEPPPENQFVVSMSPGDFERILGFANTINGSSVFDDPRLHRDFGTSHHDAFMVRREEMKEALLRDALMLAKLILQAFGSPGLTTVSVVSGEPR